MIRIDIFCSSSCDVDFFLKRKDLYNRFAMIHYPSITILKDYERFFYTDKEMSTIYLDKDYFIEYI